MAAEISSDPLRETRLHNAAAGFLVWKAKADGPYCVCFFLFFFSYVASSESPPLHSGNFLSAVFA